MATHYSSIPQDLICLKCKNIVNDPYRLPCNHSVCLCPCITSDDKAEVVRCPLCHLVCNLGDLVADKVRSDRANAFLATQRIYAQQPTYQPPAVRKESSCTPEPVELSNLPCLAQCQACNKMVFGLEYFSCFGKSICAECRKEQLRQISDKHVDKILKLKALEKYLNGVAERLRSLAKNAQPESSSIALQLDGAVAVVFSQLIESMEKAEKEVEAQHQQTESILLDLNKNMGMVLPGIHDTPLLVEQLDLNGGKYKEWRDLKKKIEQNSKLLCRSNEELLRLGTETCILNQEGIDKIRGELENFSFITDAVTPGDYDQPSRSLENSKDYRDYTVKSTRSSNNIGNLFA